MGISGRCSARWRSLGIKSGVVSLSAHQQIRGLVQSITLKTSLRGCATLQLQIELWAKAFCLGLTSEEVYRRIHRSVAGNRNLTVVFGNEVFD